MIENVGNLVCPAAFDLGEAHKVVILSVTEGEDKPIKYPDMFRAASVMLLNKIDLLPHLDFDVEAALAYARRVNPQIRVIQLSATRGEGMGEWLQFLRDGMAQRRRRERGDGRWPEEAHRTARGAAGGHARTGLNRPRRCPSPRPPTRLPWRVP